jgi:hypothetical protein
MGKQRSDVLLLKIDGELNNLDTEYPGDSTVEEINSQSEEEVDIDRYTRAHLVVQSVRRVFPDVEYRGVRVLL